MEGSRRWTQAGWQQGTRLMWHPWRRMDGASPGCCSSPAGCACCLNASWPVATGAFWLQGRPLRQPPDGQDACCSHAIQTENGALVIQDELGSSACSIQLESSGMKLSALKQIGNVSAAAACAYHSTFPVTCIRNAFRMQSLHLHVTACVQWSMECPAIEETLLMEGVA